MPTKTELITQLNDEYNRWDSLLAGLTEEQIAAPQLPSHLSIHDVIAHLYAWQQRSVARLQAGLDHTTPQFPVWAEGINPDDDDADPINAWIYSTYHDQPWTTIHDAWRQNFQRFLGLAVALPEQDLADPQKYPWLDGDPLSSILYSSYAHHHDEHYASLSAWLQEHPQIQNNVTAKEESTHMQTKTQLVTQLTDEYNAWEQLLTRLREDQIITPPSPTAMSVQDTIAHLYAWQQRSVARMIAARDNTDPVYPQWAAGLDTESEEDTDSINAHIYNLYHAEVWTTVYALWRDNFNNFLVLAEAASDESLFQTNYPWLQDYHLADVLTGSFEHHQEHREPLLARVDVPRT